MLSKSASGNHGTPPAAGNGERILASLERGGTTLMVPHRPSRVQLNGWTLALLLLLLILGVSAWLTHRDGVAPLRHALPLSARAPMPPLPALPTLLASAPAQQTMANTAPAAIVNEAAAAHPHSDNNDTLVEIIRPARPSAKPAYLPATPAGRVGNGAGRTAANTGATATTLAAGPAPRSIAKAGAGAAKPAQTPHLAARLDSPAPVRAKKPTALGATAGSAVGSDTDVALLTALVAHASAPVTLLVEESRDVVERKEGDATAGLLRRCKQLGPLEGMLCRSRICSGRWDNDAACRAPNR
ncbi:hypothetical protein H7U20_11375 [Rugamonas sp. CCM 8940]|nr:hypothetical protein [Rugamonas sp. CCM 8940]